jgi:hypothetical protein
MHRIVTSLTQPLGQRSRQLVVHEELHAATASTV